MNTTQNRPAVLVSGGAGFIGSHVAKALAEAGYLPVVLDDLSAGFESFVNWGPFYRGCCSDQQLVRSICDAHAIQACVQFAGRIEVGQSVVDPVSFYRSNVMDAITLFETLYGAGVGRIVFSSTAAVYAPSAVPIRESASIMPGSPYGRTKWMTEQFLADFGVASGLRSVVLRYFNAAGGDPDGQIGEAHRPETHLIPAVLDVAVGRRGVFKQFGSDYPTPDGTCVRDYIHVMDLADAHVRAVHHLMAGGDSRTYNVGTGHGYSVSEVIRTAEQVIGRPIPIAHAPRRAGDVASLVANCDAIQTDWGWTAIRSDLKTLIGDAWRWRQPGNRLLD